MTSQDRKHFGSYTRQNRVKHRILTTYLPAYLSILRPRVGGFHYIDGFAGPGRYANEFPGSPLLALDVITQAGVANRTSVSCVEKVTAFSAQLKDELARYDKAKSLFTEPLILQGEFHENIDRILESSIYAKLDKVATFAFVDPCGLSGVRMRDLVRILSLPYGECLLLFNYDGTNRWLGGVESGTHDITGLVNLYGERDTVDQLLRSLQGIVEPRERELLIRDRFIDALRKQSRAMYLLPFRVESQSKDRTSHYLVHCSGHSLAFKIMKDIMSRAGRDEDEKFGRLDFLNDEELGKQFALFRRDIEDQKRKIIDRIRESSCRVNVFTDEWVRRPTDAFSEKAYRDMLLELESDGAILIYDEHNEMLKPPDKRKRHGGKPTIGDKLFLQAV